MKRFAFASLWVVLVTWTVKVRPSPVMPQPVSTFSIVAFDPANAQWGVAVASRYFSVGSVVPWAEAGVGAVATQANVNVGYGPEALELLKQGLTARQVLDKLLADDHFEGRDGRQVAIVDSQGNAAAYTGANAPKWAGDKQGKNWSAQGNILVGPQVVEAMGRAFEQTRGELAERLYAAIKAGDAAGGDRRGRQSASMLVVCKQCGRNINNDRYVFINVDDNADSIGELRRLLNLNLMYTYANEAYRLLRNDKIKEALAAGKKAAAYAPNRPDGLMTLAFLEYAAGDKMHALGDFLKAKKDNPRFRQQWNSTASFVPAFRPILRDEKFLKKLFPKGRP